MNNEHQSPFEHDLASAAEPEEFDSEKAEPTHDPAKSLNRGLITLYKKHLTLIDRLREAGLIDREKVDELANDVLELANKDGLRNEIVYTSTEKAREIMGQGIFFGPNEVRKAGVEIKEDVSLIPFNPEELERAKELGQMLIYRTSTTMKELDITIGPMNEDEERNAVLDNSGPYKHEDYFNKDMIQPGWALVSKELTPESTEKNYLEQSELLAEYLVIEVFKGKPLPRKYQEAIDRLNAEKETIRGLMDSGKDADIQIAVQKLIDLKINQLFRQSPAEVIYDCLIYYQNTGEYLHESDFVWTSARASGDGLVLVGYTKFEGAEVKDHEPFEFLDYLGASFCQRGTDLKL